MKKYLTVLLTFILTLGTVGTVSASKPIGNSTPVIKTKQIKNYTISYTVRGRDDGHKADRTFVIIHGAAANSLSTNGLAEELSRKFHKAQVVQIDLPAHGKSSGPALNSVGAIADVVESFIENGRKSGEFANRIIPVGISMGGSVTQELAVRNIDGLEKVVLISTNPEWSHLAPLVSLDATTFRAIYPDMIKADYAVNTTPEQQAEFSKVFPTFIPTDDAAILGDNNALVNFNIVNRLRNVTKKTLIISGTADETAIFSNVELIANNIKKSTLITIDGETHTYSMKKPEVVAQYIYNFVK